MTPSANDALPPVLPLMNLVKVKEPSCNTRSASRLADGAVLFSLLPLQEAQRCKHQIQKLGPGCLAVSFRALYAS